MRTLTLLAAVGLLIASAANGGDCGAPGCDAASCGRDCGACPRCGDKLVCAVVCTVKEVKKTVWNVKCEPFCAPLPGFARGGNCGDPACGGDADEGCGDGACGKCNNCCDPCAVEQAKRQVPPKCSPVRYKKTLEKKEVVCKVPSYKCVPTCPNCGCSGDAGCGAAAPPPKTEPALPVAPLPSKTTQRTLLGPSLTK